MLRRVFQIAGLALLGVSFFLAGLFQPNGGLGAFIQHPATAAWAQAIGGFLAVAAAAAVAIDEAGRQRSDRERSKLERQDSAYQAARAGCDYLLAALALGDQYAVTATWSRGAPKIVQADVSGA